MWTYQPSPTEYGTASWACHQRCGDFTFWKLINADFEKIPAQHSPVAWGRREEWLSLIREQRLRNVNSSTSTTNQCNMS
jgi:hypothetical protein